MKRVEWSDVAISDLQAVKCYLDQFGSDVSEHGVSALILAATWLLENPGVGAPVGYRRWRKWKPRGERHMLIYEPTSFGISVVRVRHERNDWKPVRA